jgi:hypothetical protein
VTRPSMRFVPIKTRQQQTALMLHRTRQLPVRQRTMLSNALRGTWPNSAWCRPRAATRPGRPARRVQYRRALSPRRYCRERVLPFAGDPADVLYEPDADLLFGRMALRRRFSLHGFLSHPHSSMVTMSQKSSVPQAAKSVSQALMPDTRHYS